MRWPLDSYTITQGFSSSHQGVDLAAPSNTPIKAPESGVVTAVNNVAANYYGGLYIKMRGDSGHAYYMGHNNKNLVSAGQRVAEGQLIGYVGMTVGPGGRATGPHVHFEVSKDGRMLDARNVIKEVKMIDKTTHNHLIWGMLNRRARADEVSRDVGKRSAADVINGIYQWSIDNKVNFNSVAKELREQNAALQKEVAALKKQIAAGSPASTSATELKPGTYIVK